MKVSNYFTTFVRMTGKEAAAYLGIHRSALCLMVKDGLIRVIADPEHTQRLIYNKEDVEQVAEARKRTSGTQPLVFGPSPEEIVRTLGYNLEELRSPSRFRQVVDQRRVVATLLNRLGHTYMSIGKFLNRDHVTAGNLIHSSYLVEGEVSLAMQKLTGESVEDSED